jgi:hypothetical protein
LVAKAMNIPDRAWPDTIDSSWPGGAQWMFGLNGGGRKQSQPARLSCAGLTPFAEAPVASMHAAAAAMTMIEIECRILLISSLVVR